MDAIPSALIWEAKQQNSVTTGTGESFAGCRPKTFMPARLRLTRKGWHFLPKIQRRDPKHGS